MHDITYEKKISQTAERHVLGWVLHDFSYMGDLDRLTPDMFHDIGRRSIFVELRRAYDAGKEFTVAQLDLKWQNEEAVQHEVTACMESALNIVTVKPDVDILIKIYQANMLWLITRKDLTIDPDHAEDQIATVINKLEALMENKTIESESVADMVKRYQGDFFKEHELINVGFKEMDKCLGGLDRGDVTILAARPSIGKSALSLQIGKNLVNAGYKVGLYNLEMRGRQIYERLIASESGISLQRIRRANATLNNEAELWAEGNKRLESFDRLIITNGSKSVADIRREIRHMNYDVLIIDYMQLLRCGDRYKGNREAEVSQISRELKALAMELNIHVIALSQLNRQSRPDKEPTMAELRESGAIEQDASCIIMLWLMSDNQHRGWKVDKCRNGVLGRGAFDFDGSHMTFKEDDFQPVKKGDNAPFDEDNPFSDQEVVYE